MTAVLTDRGLVTAPLLAALEATGIPIGDAKVPAGHPSPGKPYVILEGIDGGGFTGPPFSTPDADATLVYQVTAHGWRRDQAEQVAGVMRAVILDRAAGVFATSLEVVGWRIIDRAPDTGPGAPVQEGDLFVQADRYRLAVTPA